MKKKRLLTGLLVITILFVLITVVGAEGIDITILHTNDTHGRLEEGKFAGMGFARISSLVKKYRTENPRFLLLDAGDTFHGQPIVNLVKGKSVTQILNHIGYSAMVSGNHDYDYGQKRLLELNKMTNFPILSANVKKRGNFFLQPYIIRDLGGVKVGIFGLCTPETTYKTHPDNVKGLIFINPVEAARAMVAELRKEVDVIIALSHLGLSEGSKYTSRRVAENVEGIDLIVDGHSHTTLKRGLEINDTLIVMAGEYDKNLGVVNLIVKDNKVVGKKAELISKKKVVTIKKDPEIIKLIAKIKAKNEEIISDIIGKATVELNGSREDIRTGETNLGNLITDAILTNVDADVAITNSGSIRNSIGAGEISKGDVIGVLPFGNNVVVKKIKGSTLLAVIEHGLSEYPTQEGAFPQVSGMSIVFAPSRPAGERVLKLLINGKPVEYEKLYRVAINDFMAAGGDGYEVFKDNNTVQEAGDLAKIIINYIKKHGTVSPKIEGRIRVVQETDQYHKYEVKPGDSLSEIAVLFEVNISELIKTNNIGDKDLIYVGQKILVPAR